ncbi:MAG: hypothetical protein ACE5H0_03285 [Bacteroidota bacterium]
MLLKPTINIDSPQKSEALTYYLFLGRGRSQSPFFIQKGRIQHIGHMHQFMKQIPSTDLPVDEGFGTNRNQHVLSIILLKKISCLVCLLSNHRNNNVAKLPGNYRKLLDLRVDAFRDS